ncbi:unnamed protein product [Brassica rapa]|uniref:Uncharacterized protein n=1 Tax=Brassica campestris TaxID=3711 RepID=A0A3P6AJN9_BRACM|nr:unnamed protein product [Brassica rapa]VDC84411.1 unnamed protein product [Brassica rapa]
MQQLGIYRYYNLQHLNSGHASNIISNQVTFIIYSLVTIAISLKYLQPLELINTRFNCSLAPCGFDP